MATRQLLRRKSHLSFYIVLPIIEIKMAVHEIDLDELVRNGMDHSTSEEGLKDALTSYGLPHDDDTSSATWKVLYAESQIQSGARQLPRISSRLQPAPPESASFCSLAAGTLIHRNLEERDWLLIDEALRILVHLKKRLHPTALPLCLERMGQRFTSYSHLRIVLGERARWLSRQRDSWLWLESMHHQSSELFQSSFRSWWPIYLWNHAHQPGLMNQHLLQNLSSLDTQEKQVVVEWINKHGDSSHLDILKNLSPGRSKILNRLVLNTRLKLLDPELHAEVAAFALRYMQQSLTIKKSTLDFKPLKSQLAPEVSFQLQDLNLFNEYDKDPLFQLLCTSDPSLWFPGDLEKHISDLMQTEQLEKLTQIIVCGAVLHRKEKLILLLNQAYFSHYPSGNTLELNMEGAFTHLSNSSFNQLINLILKNTDRRFEKLGLIISENSPYFSRKYSEEIVEHMVDAFYYNLPHTEMHMLSESLPYLATKIDPRVFPKLKNRISQDTIMSNMLTKDFRTFLNVLERRANLLEALTLPSQ